jgi:hypothetical protein
MVSVLPLVLVKLPSQALDVERSALIKVIMSSWPVE